MIQMSCDASPPLTPVRSHQNPPANPTAPLLWRIINDHHPELIVLASFESSLKSTPSTLFRPSRDPIFHPLQSRPIYNSVSSNVLSLHLAPILISSHMPAQLLLVSLTRRVTSRLCRTECSRVSVLARAANLPHVASQRMNGVKHGQREKVPQGQPHSKQGSAASASRSIKREKIPQPREQAREWIE